MFRKFAAAGARQGSLSRRGVFRAAHHWRAVGLPGTVEVPTLAGSDVVAIGPRSRAERWAVKVTLEVRAELAGGRSHKAPAGLPARLQLASGVGPR